jgi:hypothetical protein
VSAATALAVALALALPFVSGSAQALPPKPLCEVHATPKFGISCGDHKLDLTLTHRFRSESWDAWEGSTDTFYGLRTRVGAKYTYRDGVSIFGEFQDARTYRLGPHASGAGALYQKWGGGDTPSKTKGAQMRQVWVEVRPITGLAIRGGRQDIKLGTQAMYKEGNWKYLKIKRASQRLVGTVGWTNVERSNDGFMVQYDTEGYNYYAFAANPTTGVFDHDSAYHRQKDIVYGGLSVTAKRNTWFDNTEVRSFFLGYNDDRDKNDGGKNQKVQVFTLGTSVVGVYPMGPGNFDLLFWAAGQAGSFDGSDMIAGALIGEFGYQLPKVWSKPWFRAGVNYASGGNVEDDTSNTFFNMLPTNHLYYGFADQLAFQNLVDFFLQLMLKPHEKVSINLMFHQFWLANDDDNQYFGTGAFTKDNGAGNFGYGANPSGGDKAFAKELDVVVNVNVYKGVSVQGGYARMWGDNVVDNLVSSGARNEDTVDWGYVQVQLQY